jgi:EAL domain-containing protein (putative c-di-GMP-specific phosphodiesterase class I)
VLQGQLALQRTAAMPSHQNARLWGSGLSYLRKFEVDKIKIDRSFVQQLGQTTDSTAIITAVVTLGHAMALMVTAEGVETREQRELLSRAGCNELQGFLFSRAVPADQLDGLLSSIEEQVAA